MQYTLLRGGKEQNSPSNNITTYPNNVNNVFVNYTIPHVPNTIPKADTFHSSSHYSHQCSPVVLDTPRTISHQEVSEPHAASVPKSKPSAATHEMDISSSVGHEWETEEDAKNLKYRTYSSFTPAYSALFAPKR